MHVRVGEEFMSVAAVAPPPGPCSEGPGALDGVAHVAVLVPKVGGEEALAFSDDPVRNRQKVWLAS